MLHRKLLSNINKYLPKQKSFTKAIILLILISSMMLFNGCSSLEQLTDDVVDYTYEFSQSDNSYIIAVKTSAVRDYKVTYEEIFNNFFAYPKWKYFESDEGIKVVEFTGECLYAEQQVKALIQFQITDEGNGYISWEATYLSFNKVSQSLVMLKELIDTAIAEYFC